MRLGQLTVDPVIDGYAVMEPAEIFPRTPVAELRQEDLLNAEGLLEFPYGGFLIRAPEGQVVLFDLGAGPDPDYFPFTAPCHGLLPGVLARHGLAPRDVTDVVLSHLHADHTGWATVRGEVYFPRARHHVHGEDWRYYVSGDARPAIREHLAPLTPSAAVWEGTRTELFPWLTLVAAPGHTPGSAVGVLRSGQEQLVLVGDVLHTPAALRHPHWRGASDQAPEQAVGRRLAWQAYAREHGALLVGPHFPGLRPVDAEGRPVVR
jgi:glyoxylase-like metal-dependent hydrolase (beta-lactamase superfamily II)